MLSDKEGGPGNARTLSKDNHTTSLTTYMHALSFSVGDNVPNQVWQIHTCMILTCMCVFTPEGPQQTTPHPGKTENDTQSSLYNLDICEKEGSVLITEVS